MDKKYISRFCFFSTNHSEKNTKKSACQEGKKPYGLQVPPKIAKLWRSVFCNIYEALWEYKDKEEDNERPSSKKNVFMNPWITPLLDHPKHPDHKEYKEKEDFNIADLILELALLIFQMELSDYMALCPSCQIKIH